MCPRRTITTPPVIALQIAISSKSTTPVVPYCKSVKRLSAQLEIDFLYCADLPVAGIITAKGTTEDEVSVAELVTPTVFSNHGLTHKDMSTVGIVL